MVLLRSQILQKKLFFYHVVELSSYQLESIKNFEPKISIILNLAQDHLDRYKNFEAYVDSKFKIIKNQSHDDYLIYDFDCETITKYIKTKKIKSRLFPFSIKKKVKQGAYFLDNEINIITDKNIINMPINFLAKTLLLKMLYPKIAR